jgi:DNA-binding response OmpR family regulator
MVACHSNAAKPINFHTHIGATWKKLMHGVQPPYLRIYMGHLRHKLEHDPAHPEHIVTGSGVDYRLGRSTVKFHRIFISPTAVVSRPLRRCL